GFVLAIGKKDERLSSGQLLRNQVRAEVNGIVEGCATCSAILNRQSETFESLLQLCFRRCQILKNLGAIVEVHHESAVDVFPQNCVEEAKAGLLLFLQHHSLTAA